MNKINLTTKQVMYLAAYIEEEERINYNIGVIKVYPDENDVCVDETIPQHAFTISGGNANKQPVTLREEERINDKNKGKKVYPDEQVRFLAAYIEDAIDKWNGGAR